MVVPTSVVATTSAGNHNFCWQPQHEEDAYPLHQDSLPPSLPYEDATSRRPLRRRAKLPWCCRRSNLSAHVGPTNRDLLHLAMPVLGQGKGSGLPKTPNRMGSVRARSHPSPLPSSHPRPLLPPPLPLSNLPPPVQSTDLITFSFQRLEHPDLPHSRVCPDSCLPPRSNGPDHRPL